jgi:hypothetical protein
VTVGRTWKLWAYRYESGKLWHVGEKRWVELHQLACPIVPVLVEEILGDRFVPEVTHYGWQTTKAHPHWSGDKPSMIQVRGGNNPANLRRALMYLSMCFPYGLDAAIKHGDGDIIGLRITERAEQEEVP